MVIAHSPNSRRGNREKGILRSHPEIISFILVATLFLQIYILRAWGLGSGDDEIIVIEPTSSRGEDRTRVIFAHCPSVDPGPMKDGLVCIEKCTPPASNTLWGLGLDPYERVNVSMNPLMLRSFPIVEYPKYRLYFPEEKIHLNLTARLTKDFKGKDSIVDDGYIHPRIYTERLLRRIVSKLLRASVLDPSKNIVNTGSWIGDNALPWALMLETLQPENPGKVIAIDPSEKYIRDMIDLANVNGIGNVCAQIGVLSSNVTKVAMIGTSTEHISVHTKEFIDQGPKKRKVIFRNKASWINAVTLDSLKLQKSVSLLHLDVEGHEGALLEGARATIESSRPIIITEGFNIWPNPSDENDKLVLAVLNDLRYTSATIIPELVGIKKNARNRIWWPDTKTKDAAMAIIGKDLERDLVPWISTELPELD